MDRFADGMTWRTRGRGTSVDNLLTQSGKPAAAGTVEKRVANNNEWRRGA